MSIRTGIFTKTKHWYWRFLDSNTLDLRWKIIKKALTMRDDPDGFKSATEKLSFMLDIRFFEYSCRVAEYSGRMEGLSKARVHVRCAHEIDGLKDEQKRMDFILRCLNTECISIEEISLAREREDFINRRGMYTDD
ncbi:hypothetical protein SEA_JUMBO_73 [Gordonia phage Jumbo]|uniref:Uncharacterized protein n=1 Tax=Gordonia phage Jumbo TaxID=1887650 RepID=A0A1B3B0R1_9CAUD|nr:hypothetical protein BIZ69_gp073 [Gordonia phage Jumbo]AOE44581.1 hypothetical protein SEA_JUMBO_73 [Gordonia phage Jumbo]